jgi:acetyltransferase
MTNITLKKIFNPKSVAIIGAKDTPGSVGFGVVKNLIAGEGKRKIYFVNPSRPKVLNRDTYKSVKDIKGVVDLAIIVVPVDIVPSVIDDCITKKVSGVVIITAGFSESNEKGKKMEEDISKKLKKAGILLIGPNCLGIMNVQKDLNASFAPVFPSKGGISFLSQSGALMNSFMDVGMTNGMGFSKMASYGNEADIDLSDLILYLGDDADTKVICFYVEAIENGHKFMEIAKEVSKKKPIIGLKSGRTKGGQEAAASHTGSIAGNYQTYRAAFRQSGVIMADTLEEMFDLAKALVMQPRSENALGVVTNGGGAGVLSVDYAEEMGVYMPEISSIEIEKADKKGVLRSVSVKRNPFDIIGDALPDRYSAAIEAFLLNSNIKILLIIETTQIVTDPVANAREIVRLNKKYPKKPIICCFLGGNLVSDAVRILEDNGIPNYFELKRALRAVKGLINYDK